jgi:hypothetical protein
MGSPHIIVFIVKRKGVKGAKKTVIQPYYHHTMYGSLLAQILIPLLKVLQSHPHLFQRQNRSKKEFFNFLLMCTSYNLDEGTTHNILRIMILLNRFEYIVLLPSKFLKRHCFCLRHSR